MTHSTKRKSHRNPPKTDPGKPTKPHPDFPLFPHRAGYWTKKIRGKFEYFTKVADDPRGEAALDLWLEQKDDLLAGRRPRPKSDALTIAGLANRFLTHKTNLLDSGELAQRTFDRYYQNCEMLISFFGKNRPVDDLRPDDFQELRASIAKRVGHVAVANEIQMTRSVFKFGFDSGLLDRPTIFGPGFKKPSAKILRQNRVAHGPKMFEAAQIHAMLAVATTNARAMILLAINGGLGNTDLALLPLSAIDLKRGWLNYPRPKTAIMRRIPLWPETIAAIRAVKAQREKYSVPKSEELLFIGIRGQNYVCGNHGYRVNQELRRIIARAKIKGRVFYDLRRTFQTIAEDSRDLTATQAIMGHAAAASDMSAIYRQRIEDSRLEAVTNHVRAWLFGGNMHN